MRYTASVYGSSRTLVPSFIVAPYCVLQNLVLRGILLLDSEVSFLIVMANQNPCSALRDQTKKVNLV